MTVSIEEYNKIKKQVDKLQTAADKAAGALDQQMAALGELGCETIEDAERLLADLKADEAAAEADYNDALAAFEEEWADDLENI